MITSAEIPTTLVPPGHDGVLVGAVEPCSICHIYAAGSEDQFLTAVADPRGQVRLHYASLPDANGKETTIVIDSTKGEQRMRRQLRVQCTDAVDRQSPSPDEPIRKGGKHRAGLTRDEALSLTQQQAFKEGFPRRPDPSLGKDALDWWLELVSRPVTIVDPVPVARPDRVRAPHGPVTVSEVSPDGLRFAASSIWSGVVATSGPYFQVCGEWYVPRVTTAYGASADSGMWVGIDGWFGGTYLAQAGTEQSCFNSPFGLFSSYSLWNEVFPLQPTGQTQSNFAVGPGDNIFIDIWIVDAAGNEEVNGATARFLAYSAQTGIAQWNYTDISHVNVPGGSAEWIMERPSKNGVVQPLANYGVTSIYNVTASGPGLSTNPTDPNTNPIMVNMDNAGGFILSEPELNNSSIQFTWLQIG
jgi:Peptidase A4 family